MKKNFLLLLILFCAFADAFAQKIQYSRQTFPSPFADAVQMMADVAGNHHVLCFTANKKPLIYVTNAALQSFEKREVDVRLKEGSDVRTLSFGSYYLLYLHVPGTSLHQLFKISADGDAEDVSDVFSGTTDTAWNHSTATFQLYKNNNRLTLVTYTYFDTIKSFRCRIIRFDETVKMVEVTSVFFPYDKDVDNLQQTVLADNALFVLKTFKDDDYGNSLSLLKVEVPSGETTISSFASGSLFYTNLTMHVNETDQSVLLYSVLRESATAQRFPRKIFIADMDSLLQMKKPLATLSLPFKANTAASFLLLNGRQQNWLAVQIFVRIRVAGNRFSFPLASRLYDPLGMNDFSAQNYAYEPRIEFNTPTAVHLTVVNAGLTAVKDSVAENRGSFYEVQPRPYGKFMLRKKAYLLLIENFSTKKHGLLLFSGNTDGGLSTTSLPVYDRYDYLLPQVQAVKDYFLVPYVHKNEIGLVKITMTE